jgi:hypothetical protein
MGSGSKLFNRLQSANIASDEGENCNSDAALDEDTQYGVLEDSRGHMRAIAVRVFGDG